MHVCMSAATACSGAVEALRSGLLEQHALPLPWASQAAQPQLGIHIQIKGGDLLRKLVPTFQQGHAFQIAQKINFKILQATRAGFFNGLGKEGVEAMA